jgi:hypothetical protein
LVGATLLDSTAVLGEAGILCADFAGLSTVGPALAVTLGVGSVFFFGVAAWSGVTAYNVLNTPTAWSEW